MVEECAQLNVGPPRFCCSGTTSARGPTYEDTKRKNRNHQGRTRIAPGSSLMMHGGLHRHGFCAVGVFLFVGLGGSRLLISRRVGLATVRWSSHWSWDEEDLHSTSSSTSREGALSSSATAKRNRGEDGPPTLATALPPSTNAMIPPIPAPARSPKDPGAGAADLFKPLFPQRWLAAEFFEKTGAPGTAVPGAPVDRPVDTHSGILFDAYASLVEGFLVGTGTRAASHSYFFQLISKRVVPSVSSHVLHYGVLHSSQCHENTWRAFFESVSGDESVWKRWGHYE